MKKIKMKFPDGSVREIDDADVATARSLGAVEFNETTPQKNGKKVTMQFGDGVIKEIDSADVAVAESLGGVKKKEAGTYSLGIGGAQAISQPGTETTGQSSSLLMSDTKVESIEDYNNQFENITGHHKFDLSAPTGKPGFLSLDNFNRRKAEAEKRKFTEYRTDEEDINKVRASAYFGSNSLADELKTLATKPYGSQAVKQIISDYGGAVSPEAFQEDVSKIDFNEVAKNIIEKNRVNGVTALDNLDTRAKTAIDNAITSLEIKTDIRDPVYTPGGGTLQSEVIATDKIPFVDFDDEKSLADAIKFLDDKGYLVDKAGKKSEGYDIKKLRDDLNIVFKNLVSKKPIDPAIENITQNIGSAVTDHFMRSNKDVKAVINEGDEVPDYTSQINTQTEHFKAGLNYIKFLKPNVYKNVVRALTDKNEISARDYTQISRLGQDIVNENVFRKSATDPSLIGAETSYDYNTKEERKAVIGGEIGELAKAKGYKGIEFSQNLVNRLGRELGYSGDDSEIVQELALEEGIGGYDAIPKSGGVNAFLRGLQQPLSGIGSTFKKWFDESPAETYLRSQRLDVGSAQQVPDAKGQYSERLPSDRNNIWYDVLEGTAQFIPQVLLTKGIGSGLVGAAELGLSSVPRAALTVAQSSALVNYGGTFISQFLQTYGDAYSSALQKTGDPGLARLMGGIDATTTAFSEFILPDIKIAEKAFSGLKKNLITDIAGVFKKGAGLSELRQKSRPFIEKFFTEAVDISRQEVSEEVLSQWANYLDEAIFSPKTVKDRDFAQETWDTINGTAKALLVPSLFGAGGVALNKDFSVQGLHASALNFEKSKNDLQDALGNGAITQDEYNNSIKLLQTHRNNLFTAPTDNGFGQPLSKQQVFDFAFQETNLKVLKDELKNTDSDVQKELINQKIKTAEDIQRDILFKETPKVKKPSDTIEKPESNIADVNEDKKVSFDKDYQVNKIISESLKEPSILDEIGKMSKEEADDLVKSLKESLFLKGKEYTPMEDAKLDEIDRIGAIADKLVDSFSKQGVDLDISKAYPMAESLYEKYQQQKANEQNKPTQDETLDKKTAPPKESIPSVSGDNPFKESKVKEPVYRASTGGSFSDKNSKGIYFTTNKEYADLYNWDMKTMKPKESGVVSTNFVNLKNPLIIETKGPKGDAIKSVYDKAVAEGHDGIIARDPDHPNVNEILVFDKSQIHKVEEESLPKEQKADEKINQQGNEQNQPAQVAPISFRTDEQSDKIIKDADQLTVSQRALQRDIPDIVDPDKKKTSVKDLKNRYNALQELIVNCLR